MFDIRADMGGGAAAVVRYSAGPAVEVIEGETLTLLPLGHELVAIEVTKAPEGTTTAIEGHRVTMTGAGRRSLRVITKAAGQVNVDAVLVERRAVARIPTGPTQGGDNVNVRAVLRSLATHHRPPWDGSFAGLDNVNLRNYGA